MDIAGIYDSEVLEEACRLALKDFYLITYNTLVPYVKRTLKSRKNEPKGKSIKEQKQGLVRGADYYSRKDD